MTTMTANPNDKPVAKLRVEAYGDWTEQVYPLFAGMNYIGRDPDNCNVCLEMPFIAATHLQIGNYDQHVHGNTCEVRNGRPTKQHLTLFPLSVGLVLSRDA